MLPWVRAKWGMILGWWELCHVTVCSIWPSDNSHRASARRLQIPPPPFETGWKTDLRSSQPLQFCRSLDLNCEVHAHLSPQLDQHTQNPTIPNGPGGPFQPTSYGEVQIQIQTSCPVPALPKTLLVTEAAWQLCPSPELAASTWAICHLHPQTTEAHLC